MREFEYDSQIALDAGTIKDDTLQVVFPHSALLYLRSDKNTPDVLKIIIQTSGGTATYNIQVLKIQSYNIDEIFDKKLYFLIPFYIFTHESKLKCYNEDSKELEKLQAEYKYIKDRLEQLCMGEVITEYEKCMLIDMQRKVLENLAEKYSNVVEGVNSIMVGKVLDYEAKRILNEGISQGISQGKTEVLLGLVKEGLLSIEDAAKRLHKSVDDIRLLL